MSIYLETLCWKEVLPKFNSQRVGDWNNNVLAGKMH